MSLPNLNIKTIKLPLWLVFLTLAVAPRAKGASTNDWRQLSRTNLLQFVSKGKVATVRSIEDWQKRRESIKAAMQEVMGPLPGKEKRCPLDLRAEEESDLGEYVRRLITYAAEPNERVRAYLLIPKNALAGKMTAPAVLALHQTHPLGQKVVVGLSN